MCRRSTINSASGYEFKNEFLLINHYNETTQSVQLPYVVVVVVVVVVDCLIVVVILLFQVPRV